MMLCLGSRRLDTPMACAVFWVSIIRPRTPVLDVTVGCHNDSWYPMAASRRQSTFSFLA
ncbi:hypothetical protein D3C74_448490 [compost metagenome]